MSKELVVVTGLIYVYVALEQYMKVSMGTSIMFLGYALANVGVYFTIK